MFGCTNQRMHYIMAYIRYTHLRINGLKGRRCLTMLAQDEGFCIAYSRLVRSITFSTKHTRGDKIGITTLCKALRKTTMLRSLSIHMPTDVTDFFYECLSRSCIIRAAPSSTQVVADPWSIAGMYLTLPRLEILAITDCVPIIDLCLFRYLTTVSIGLNVGWKSLDRALAALGSGGIPGQLHHFGICLEKDIPISMALRVLASTLSGLRTLKISQRGISRSVCDLRASV